MKKTATLMLMFLSTSVAQIPTHVELGVKPGNKRTIRETNFFVPLVERENGLLFSDIRGMIDTKSQKEGNIGLAYRHMFTNFIVGAYGFGDIRRSQYNNTHYQGTFGFEFLTNFFDLRVNGYIPKEKKFVVSSTPVAQIVDNRIVTGDRITYEKSLRGFDVEAGFRLDKNYGLLHDFPFIDNIGIYAARYHFHNRSGRSISGHRARIEASSWQPFSASGIPFLKGAQLTLGAEISKDKVRKTNRFMEVRLRIPLRFDYRSIPEEEAGLRRRLSDRIIRDVDIVSDNSISLENTQDFNPAQLLGISDFTVDNTYWVDFKRENDGDGTFENPWNRFPTDTDVSSNALVLFMPGGSKYLENFEILPHRDYSNVAFVSLNTLKFPSYVQGGVRDKAGNVIPINGNNPHLVVNEDVDFANHNGTRFLWSGIDITSNYISQGVDYSGAINVDQTVVFRDCTIRNNRNSGSDIIFMYVPQENATTSFTLHNVTLTSTATTPPTNAFGIFDTYSGGTGTVTVNLEKVTMSNAGVGLTGELSQPTANYILNFKGGVDLSGVTTDYTPDITIPTTGSKTINISTEYGANTFNGNAVTTNWTVNNL